MRRAGAAGQLWAGMKQRWTERNSADTRRDSPRTRAGEALAQYTCRNSPTDDLLGLARMKCSFSGSECTGRTSGPSGLPVHHVCALVHVDGALWEGCGLQEEGRAGVTLGAEGNIPVSPGPSDPLGFSISTGASQASRLPCHAEHGGGLPPSLGPQPRVLLTPSRGERG